MAEIPDDEIVARAKAGDAEAWRELYRAHAGRLVTWLATRPSGDSMVAAEDVAAEAWLVAADKVADFHGSSSDFAGWLFGIARKIGGSTKRRSDRRRTSPSDPTDLTALADLADGQGHGSDPTLVLDGGDWVRRALATLPPRERDAVGLVEGLGFDQQGAARVLGISPVALRVARHRGLRRLRRELGPRPRDAEVGTAR
jgi:RNA polymerase sigma-70 factor (ECF subfamily)